MTALKRPAPITTPSYLQNKLAKKARTGEKIKRSINFNSPESQEAMFNAYHLKMTPKLTKIERGNPLPSQSFINLEGASDICSFLKSQNIKSSAPHKKSPKVLIITRKALRACEFYKELSFSGFRSAKLFAKHLKIEEQKKLLESNVYDIGIGTPNRILRLLEANTLELVDSRIIIIDLSKDVKDFNIFTMPNVAEDFFKLFREYFARQNRLKYVLW